MDESYEKLLFFQNIITNLKKTVRTVKKQPISGTHLPALFSTRVRLYAAQ